MRKVKHCHPDAKPKDLFYFGFFGRLRFYRMTCAGIILSFLLIGNLFAQPATQDLQNKLAKLQNMTADFQQIIVGQDGAILQKVFGKMTLEKPNKFIWETMSEPRQLIIANEKKMWIYDRQLRQVTIRSLTSSIKQTPLLLLINSPHNLAKNFIVSANDAKDQFRLRSKDKNSMFTLIIVSFIGGAIKQINFVNQFGQKTNILFSKIVINQKNISGFNFVVPKNVDVISEP